MTPPEKLLFLHNSQTNILEGCFWSALACLVMCWSSSQAQNFATTGFGGPRPTQIVNVKVDTSRTVAPVFQSQRKTGFSFRDLIPSFLMPLLRPIIGESGASPGPFGAPEEYLSQFPIVTGPIVGGPIVGQ